MKAARQADLVKGPANKILQFAPTIGEAPRSCSQHKEGCCGARRDGLSKTSAARMTTEREWHWEHYFLICPMLSVHNGVLTLPIAIHLVSHAFRANGSARFWKHGTFIGIARFLSSAGVALTGSHF